MVEQQTQTSWDAWKRTLAQAVQTGQQVGMGQERMVQVAEKIGDFLARQVEPQNPQQRVLKEMWEAASPQEQETLARVIVKMVSH